MNEKKEPAPKPDPPGERQDVHVRTNRCPYCHDDIRVEGSDWVACRSCQARHHQACWEESGACGSCGEARFVADVPQHPGAEEPLPQGGPALHHPDQVQVDDLGVTILGGTRIDPDKRRRRFAFFMALGCLVSALSWYVPTIGVEKDLSEYILLGFMIYLGLSLLMYWRTGVDTYGFSKRAWGKAREAEDQA